MEKLYYESPTVAVDDVRVEGGFGLSDYGNGGIGDYGTIDEGNMDEIGSY